jgi:hypothetical protein
MEGFKKIGNHPELENYLISENGQIYNVKTGIIRKQHIKNGYYIVSIKNKAYTVHRLVAETYIKTDDYSLYIDHIDRNKINNHKYNLRWVTQKENLKNIDKDICHPRRVIKKDSEGNILATYNNVTEAGKANGVTRYAISKACLKLNKTCQGFVFDYEDDKFKHKDINISRGKKIENYEHYIAFKSGKIYNTRRKAYLKPIKNANSYSYVTLCKNLTKKNFYIHQIIAKAFLENDDPENKRYVNHKNKKRSDNRVKNLEWVTASENNIHARSR